VGERFLETLEDRARQTLPEAVFRYYRQGARDGVTAGESVAAWDRFRFLPQVLRDVTDVDTSTTLLGTTVQTPIAVAPTALQRAAHPDGEVAMAKAVKRAGSLMVVSSNSGSTFEDIAATGVTWWLQLYLTAERPASMPLVERAVAAGAQAIVLTVDTPVVGTKYDDGPSVWDIAESHWLRANLPPDQDLTFGDEKATDLGPQDVAWLAETSGLPVVVKGVLQPNDVRRCVDAGAAAVWVSNHGGRQLDRAAATADALPAVVEAAGNDAEVYVDGGLRSGLHALAALALGARAAFFGRLPLYALAADGEAGVSRMFEELDAELVEALTLTGCASATLVPPRILA
jgi:4-hydroxymandelate oxidase